MSALYNPPQAEHLVMVGPDWWGCLCWGGGGYSWPSSRARDAGRDHAVTHSAETVTTDWGWDDVSAVGTPDEVHRWLWEQNAI